MRISIHIVAWTLLSLAFLSWAGVYLWDSSIQAQAQASATEAHDAEAQLDRLAFQKRLTAIAVDTVDERAQLDALVTPDIVDIVNTVEHSDASGKLGLQVTDARQAGGATDLPGGGSLQALEIVISARGSYSALMRQVRILEKLPLVSSVGSVELEKVSGGTAPWHLVVHMRVYTTAPISS